MLHQFVFVKLLIIIYRNIPNYFEFMFDDIPRSQHKFMILDLLDSILSL